MLKRVFVIGLLAGLPLAAAAQQFDRPNSGARLISPLPQPAPPAAIPTPPVASGLPDQTAREVEATAPPAAIDRRGTEQSPLAVKLIPAPKTAAELADETAARQERASNDLWLMLLTAAVVSAALLQLGALLAFMATTRRQHRAYVFVSGAEIVDLDIAGAPVVAIEIKNTGQTPAYALTHAWRCGIFDYPLQQKLLLPHNNDPISWPHLGPGASAKAQRTAEKQITSGGQPELTNRATAFYVYCEIAYRDAFKKMHVTRYVLFHAGLPRMGPGQLLAYEKGNEAS